MAWRGNPENKVPTPVKTELINDVGQEKENRAKHVRRDKDFQKNWSISIKDIDETVFKHLQDMQLSIVENGNNINVPVYYASPEKWKSVRHDGFMRDANGRVILPALIFYRQSSESDQTMTMFNKYLRYSVMKTYSVKNQYTKFSTLTGKNIPTNEIYHIVMPDYMNFNYKFVVWTESVEQNNALIERINFETNDYWGQEKGFRFRTFVNSYTHTTEVESDSDRMVKTEFDLVLRGYLLPDLFAPGLDGFRPTTEKTFTAKKVIMGMEVVDTGWQPNNANSIEDKWRSQYYHNLKLGKEPISPPINVKNTPLINNIRPIKKTSTSSSTTSQSEMWDNCEDNWDSSDKIWS